MTNDDIPPLLDKPHAPDVFADRATGFHHLNGNMRITLEATRVSHVSDPGSTNRVVIGRLIMPLATAEALAKEILDFVATKVRSGEQDTFQDTSRVH